MASRTALEVTVTAKGRDLVRMDGDVAHRLYRPESVFTVCGVRVRGLDEIPEGPLLRSTLRFCRRCWADSVVAQARPASARRATNEVIKNDG